jgi:hypothetical protein
MTDLLRDAVDLANAEWTRAERYKRRLQAVIEMCGHYERRGGGSASNYDKGGQHVAQVIAALARGDEVQA